MDAAVNCFTNITLLAMDLEFLGVPSESPNSLTGSLTHWDTTFRKRITFIDDTGKVKLSTAIVNFPTTGSLLTLQSSVIDLIGWTA
jgi:hypothetical protein